MPFNRTDERVRSGLYRDKIKVKGASGIDFDGAEIRGLYFAVDVGLEFTGSDRSKEVFCCEIVLL
jgi:hypothetical protein